jgi:arylformamidase
MHCQPTIADRRLAMLFLENPAMVRLIDLSHPLEHGQLAFPGDPPVCIDPHATIAAQQYNLTRLSMGSHQGTHLDAPSHFYKGGRTADRLDLGQCYGAAVLVDLAPGSALRPGTAITPQMLRRHSSAFGVGARVIYRTGWGRRFGRSDFFEGYPSLTPDAARWIASRRISLLGMDTPSLSSDWLQCHRILLKKGSEVVILESLANLDRLPRRFTLVALPLKLRGVDGSPVRAMAIVRSNAGGRRAGPGRKDR